MDLPVVALKESSGFGLSLVKELTLIANRMKRASEYLGQKTVKPLGESHNDDFITVNKLLDSNEVSVHEIVTTSEGLIIPTHSHEESVQVYSVVHGQIGITIEGAFRVLESKGVATIPAGFKHQSKCISAGGCRFILVTIPKDKALEENYKKGF